MRVRVAALIFSLAVAWLPLSTASSYHLFGYRWMHPATYCADPSLVEAMRLWDEHAAVPDGGPAATPDIACVREPLAAGLGGYAAPVFSADGSIHSCAIHVNTAYADSLYIWVHELGHCLGLAHSCEGNQLDCTLLERQAIMAFDGGTAGINADDDVAIQALYGPPAPPPPPHYRLVAPGAARD